LEIKGGRRGGGIPPPDVGEGYRGEFYGRGIIKNPLCDYRRGGSMFDIYK
jgi:hypothetical protein